MVVINCRVVVSFKAVEKKRKIKRKNGEKEKSLSKLIRVF